jgi:hypothetical protein
MKKMFVLFGFVFIILVAISSCKNEDGTGLLLDDSIPPVITTLSTSESFKYTIDGTKYTKQEVYELKVTADTIRYSFATASIKSGQMELIVELKDGSKLISRSLSGVIAVTDYRKIKSPLSKVIFNYSDFTGQFSFNINEAF